jgi:hypothetical protein
VGGCSISSVDWGSNLSVSWGSNNSLLYEGLLVDNSVESVYGISGVFNGTTGAVRLGERVRSSYDISVAGLVLVLAVSGKMILYVIRVRVLWVGIVVSIDGDLSDGGDSDLSYNG